MTTPRCARRSTRRYTRIREGEYPAPDLLLIDGGLGQINEVHSVLVPLGFEDVTLIGIAKGAERRPGQERLFVSARTHRSCSSRILRLRGSFSASAMKLIDSPSPVIAAGARAAITNPFWRRSRAWDPPNGARCCAISGDCKACCAPAPLISSRSAVSAQRSRGVFMITSTPATSTTMPWNLPNTLTWIRIAAIPLIVVLFYAPYSWADPAAGLLFAAAGVTDSLDGYFARRLGQTSRLGAFLDPVADKLIVAVALVLLVSKDPRALIVLTAAVTIGREIAISALREWMAEIGQRRKVAVSQLGKYKTTLQIIGLVDDALSPGHPRSADLRSRVVLTVVAAILTLSSMVAYLRIAWPELRR
jgi:CDP-diacylglycerol--glycerol-3-phosphate 3-phosphatidyltransferase